MYFKKTSEERHIFRKVNYICYCWITKVSNGQSAGTTFIVLERWNVIKINEELSATGMFSVPFVRIF